MTSSPRSARRGKQQPRVLFRPKFDSDGDGIDACGLMESCGQPLDEFQVLLTLVTLASLAGRLSASEVGALIARQNGKGGWLEAVAIFSLFEVWLYGDRNGLTGGKNTTLWTAHELKTSDEAYARVKGLIEANPDLAAEVVVWNGGLTGTHIIQLRDGSRLVFLARSKSSGRGFSPRRIIFDEAQEFSAQAFRAMMYATSAQGDRRQIIYAGTVPDASNDATIWTGVRDRGRAAKGDHLAWLEWSPTGSENPDTPPDPTDWTARAEANPALGIRILSSTIDEEWDAAQADIPGFLRERLSVWPDAPDATNIVRDFPVEDWLTVTDPNPANSPGKMAAFAVEVDRDRAWASISAAGRRADDKTQVEVVDRHRGTAWLVTRCVELDAKHGPAKFVIDGGGAAGSLEVPLREAGLDVEVFGTADVAKACAAFVDAVIEHMVIHGPDELLATAVEGCRRKVFRDGGFTFSRIRSEVDVTPLMACILAFWQTLQGDRPPEVWSLSEMVEKLRNQQTEGSSGFVRPDGVVFTPF